MQLPRETLGAQSHTPELLPGRAAAPGPSASSFRVDTEIRIRLKFPPDPGTAEVPSSLAPVMRVKHLLETATQETSRKNEKASMPQLHPLLTHWERE